jgi:hypothetical protein
LSEKVEQVLTSIINEYGVDICHDYRRVEALLNDRCPTEKRYVTVLSRALTERIARILINNNNVVPREILFSKLQARLQDKLAITKDAAVWAVETWAKALTPPTEAMIGGKSTISFSGTDALRTQMFALRQGLAIFSSNYLGSDNFIVELYNTKNNFIGLVANDIGQSNSAKPMHIPNSGEYYLLVSSAVADWSIDVIQLFNVETICKIRKWKGSGQEYFITWLPEKDIELEITYEGEDNFSLMLLNFEGKAVSCLANEVGVFTVKKSLKIKDRSYYVFDISGQGDWSVQVNIEEADIQLNI